MQFIIGGGFNTPYESLASPGFSGALGAQVLVAEPPLSDRGQTQVIDYFVVETELAKLVTSVSTDFERHARPHFPIRI
eukprot:2204628-Pyramimonas_sp.AAC.1